MTMLRVLLEIAVLLFGAVSLIFGVILADDAWAYSHVSNSSAVIQDFCIAAVFGACGIIIMWNCTRQLAKHFANCRAKLKES